MLKNLTVTGLIAEKSQFGCNDQLPINFNEIGIYKKLNVGDWSVNSPQLVRDLSMTWLQLVTLQESVADHDQLHLVAESTSVAMQLQSLVETPP